MFRLPEFRRLFRFGVRRPEAIPGDVDAEVEFHLKMRVQELMARGLAEAEAQAEAARRFGDVTAARAELIAADLTARSRAARSDWLADLGRDLRFAARELRRHWSFAAVAVTVLEETPEGVWVTGLRGDARVITAGQSYVSEGQKVRASSR